MKERIISLLKSTKREGIENLIKAMEDGGFFESPCSTQHHLSKDGGLAEHSYNVYEYAMGLADCFGISKDEDESILICSILHDLGKMGQFGKKNYVPNMLKGRVTKSNPNPEPTQSVSKPYKSNSDLMYVDHEVRSIVIAQQYITLTEEEQQAILWHNGLYGTFKYQIQGKEFPLYMILHFADMWASRVIEREDSEDEV